MTQEELRKEFIRLTNLNSIQDSKDLIEIYLNYFFEVSKNHHKEAKTYANIEAEMINQMIFTKIAHLKELINGIQFLSKDGIRLKKIIDPTIVATHIRNLYETVGMFNLIFIKTNSGDEKTILYNLWVHAGLKFRQRFEKESTRNKTKEKLENERQQIEALKKEIESTKLYNSLDEKNQNKIQTKLKEKDYKIKFVDNNVVFLSWQELASTMGVNEGLMDNIYTYFSLYSHPSNVSVFQFSNMFKKGEEAFIEMTNFNLINFFFLLSIFIADYIKLFPKVLATFENLSQIEQIVINSLNTMIRSRDYSINDEWKALG